MVLRNVYEPQPPTPPQTARYVVPGLSDRLKQRWNTELEAAVRKAQAFEWEAWRRGAEDRVAGLWGKGVAEVVDEAKKSTR